MTKELSPAMLPDVNNNRVAPLTTTYELQQPQTE